LNEAREEFENIRGVSVREVNLEVVNESWVLKNWGLPYIDYEELIIKENIYKALFLISQDVNLTDAQLEWTGIYHAAVWQGKIYIVKENFDFSDKFKVKSTLIHELTHIMQENYSLPTKSTFDGSRALTSLKEGDATLMADTFKNGGVVPPSAEVTMPNTSSLPQSIYRLNLFVYRYGVEFIKALYEKGGWKAVNCAYMNPPSTTEQIIHPEKYFALEDAAIIEAFSVNDNWNLKKTDRFGEYFIEVMLDNWISIDKAQAAAEGWGGDIMNYYERDKDFLFNWNITWDSRDDAHEFYIAFQEMMYKTSAEKHNCSYWFNDARYISIQWNNKSTLITSSNSKII
jgi:hypothetical protein